jgi:SAM-dependent methyltransferase
MCPTKIQLSKYKVFNILRCPISGQSLKEKGFKLISENGDFEYNVTTSGIPLFAESFCSNDVERQRDHYNKIADNYIKNLGYPHTEEYLRYLDRVFIENLEMNDLSKVAELCCGHGELLTLISKDIDSGIGVDISESMLEFAKLKHRQNKEFLFVQADATRLPFESNSFSSVFMFGGIHHVPNRLELFQEVFRILQPGGRFYFREPVSDFFLWRWIRAFIYSISPALDAQTERPLQWRETVPVLNAVGFRLKTWSTYGFLGFCFFMNSDVLVFNRLFRFIPGIRSITRFATYIDDLTLKIPGLGAAGLQVVGVAEKPISKSI